MQIQKVLCPVDFTAASEEALEYAVSLAWSFQSELYLLYVIDTNISPDNKLTSDEINGIKQELEKRALNHLRSQVIHTEHCLKIETRVSTGEPFITALELAMTEEVDLIVINKPKNDKWKNLEVSRSMEIIFRATSRPVLAIGSKVKKPKWQQDLN